MGTEGCESTEQMRARKERSDSGIVAIFALRSSGRRESYAKQRIHLISEGQRETQTRCPIILHTITVLLRYHIEFGNYTHFHPLICPTFRQLVGLCRIPARVHFTCSVDINHQSFSLILSTQWNHGSSHLSQQFTLNLTLLLSSLS